MLYIFTHFASIVQFFLAKCNNRYKNTTILSIAQKNSTKNDIFVHFAK